MTLGINEVSEEFLKYGELETWTDSSGQQRFAAGRQGANFNIG
jgi:hypothetical protein